MDIQNDILWELFPSEDKAKLIACYQNGDWQNLCCLPGVNIDTPEKEDEIEKMVLELMPLNVESDESEVRAKLEKFWQEKKQIETPEQEKEWEDKLEAERKAEKLKRKKMKEKKDAERKAKIEAKKEAKEKKK